MLMKSSFHALSSGSEYTFLVVEVCCQGPKRCGTSSRPPGRGTRPSHCAPPNLVTTDDRWQRVLGSLLTVRHLGATDVDRTSDAGCIVAAWRGSMQISWWSHGMVRMWFFRSLKIMAGKTLEASVVGCLVPWWPKRQVKVQPARGDAGRPATTWRVPAGGDTLF